MEQYYRVAPAAGLAVDEGGNPETCYVRIEGEAPGLIGRTLGQMGICPQHVTEISKAEYLAAIGDSAT